MPPIVHTPTTCGRHPFVTTSDIVALQAASLVVVPVIFSVHDAMTFIDVRPYSRGDGEFSDEESEPNLSFDLTDLPESPLSFEPETPPGTLLYTHEELCAFKFADGFVVQF